MTITLGKGKKLEIAAISMCHLMKKLKVLFSFAKKKTLIEIRQFSFKNMNLIFFSLCKEHNDKSGACTNCATNPYVFHVL